MPGPCSLFCQMNWLAHLFLSEPTPAFRIGNLLPDFVPVAALTALPAEFQRGIQCHRRIDAFTDAHPIFRASMQRLSPPFRRYGGIIIDIFYDHFLAGDWSSVTDQPLTEFAAEFYASVEALRADIPAEALEKLQSLCATDWLCSYRTVDGIADALRRTSARLRRPFDLTASVGDLELRYAELREDFRTFFPQLRAHLLRHSA